jgi:hypothetical protein
VGHERDVSAAKETQDVHACRDNASFSRLSTYHYREHMKIDRKLQSVTYTACFCTHSAQSKCSNPINALFVRLLKLTSSDNAKLHAGVYTTHILAVGEAIGLCSGPPSNTLFGFEKYDCNF